jgi:hypothetical protein
MSRSRSGNLSLGRTPDCSKSRHFGHLLVITTVKANYDTTETRSAAFAADGSSVPLLVLVAATTIQSNKNPH